MPPRLVPELLRTRPIASTEHFRLHARSSTPSHGVREHETSDETSNRKHSGRTGRAMLIIAVPKRLVRRAVDRNTLRRVARESWRAAGFEGSNVAALLRMTVALDAAGVSARKRLAREEMDRLFTALSRRLGLEQGGQ